ncbi:MAG TPA: prepilin-type N-terminal cleavage/methylation domain-containing protein [Candidatus Saccharimonadales bacterium]|nr:prepilin-type N-terminal cleavage/methylation domain-containing protein [Candidatus Saccharimonadales bacterium]
MLVGLKPRQKTSVSSQQGGFTMIELLLAMALFSFVLLLVAAGFLQVVKLYQSGLASRNTQQNARFGMEQMIRQARGATGAQRVAATPFTDVLCLNGESARVRFYVGAGDRLYRDIFASNAPCAAGASPPANAISSPDVRVVGFSAVPVTDTTGPVGVTSVQLTLRVASDVTLLNPARTACDPAASGSQFCSLTTFTSTASLRGRQ